MKNQFFKLIKYLFGYGDRDMSTHKISNSIKTDSQTSRYPLNYDVNSYNYKFNITSKFSRTKGFTEDLLFKELIKLFPENIYVNLETNFNGLIFEPDIAYIDKVSKKYIDIEIDEPYTLSLNGLTPIHYLSSDDNRNTTFTSNGWRVIRVSEKQVFCNLKQTVKYIENIILENDLNQEFDYDIQFSFQQTEQAIKEKYRENYLGITSLTSIAKESYYVYGSFIITKAIVITNINKLLLHVKDYNMNQYEVYLDPDIVTKNLNEAIMNLVPVPYFTTQKMFKLLFGLTQFTLVCKGSIKNQNERQFLNIIDNEIQFIPTSKFIVSYNQTIEYVNQYLNNRI